MFNSNTKAMTPCIIDLNTGEIVYEGIDIEDCFMQLRHHFLQNIHNPGKYQVQDVDEGVPIPYETYLEIKRLRRAAREMLQHGG